MWTDSVVRVTAIGLLGGRGLEITPGVAGAPTVYEQGDVISELLIDGHKVPFAQAPKGVYLTAAEEPALSDRAQKLVSTVEQALPNILGLTNQLYTVLTNTAQLTAAANQVVMDTHPLVTNLTAITANLRGPHRSLGQWIVPPQLNTNLVVLTTRLNDTILNLAAITSNPNAQVESNDKILSQISGLVTNTDNLVQGLKKHWLLRGLFQKMNSQTNAAPSNAQPARPAEQQK